MMLLPKIKNIHYDKTKRKWIYRKQLHGVIITREFYHWEQARAFKKESEK